MMLDISVFDLDDVLLVFVDGRKEFAFDLAKVLSDFVFIEEACLLLEDKVCIVSTVT